MKFHTERVEIERGGVQGEKTFSIKTTARAFDILSSGLYTDPILAIVRELSCNAYDAHIAAGKGDQPFTIHLPNRLEPWFAVIDNGIGLDHEGVINLYTTYFDTTKDQSNDFIGALGLGSKSPFSYTKAFEVIARFDGKRRIYTAFINEEGVPTIAKMGETDTDECNGLEVKLTIHDQDFSKFADRTATALMWFSVKPNIVGNAYFRFDKLPETYYKGDGWAIFKKLWNENATDLTAVQGNVAYRVDLSQLQSTDLEHTERTLLKEQRLVLFCNIGELEVAASREEIRYDDRTKEALVKRINAVLQLFRDRIEAKAEEFKSKYWDAHIALDALSMEMFSKHKSLRTFMSVSAKSPTLQRYIRCADGLRLPHLEGLEVIEYTHARHGQRLVRSARYAGTQIVPRKNREVFINDLPSGGVARLAQYAQHPTTPDIGLCDSIISIVFNPKPLKTIELPVPHPADAEDKVPMTEAEVQAEFDKLVDALGNPTIKVVSKDTKPIVRDAIPRSTPIYRFGGTYSSTNRWTPDKVRWNKVRWSDKNDDDFDPEKGGIYFLLRHRAHMLYTDMDGKERTVGWSVNDITPLLKSAATLIAKHVQLPFDTTDEYWDSNFIFGVRSLARKHVEDREHWFDMFALLRDIVPLYKEQIIHLQRWRATTDDMKIKHAIDFESFVKMVQQLSPTSWFYQSVMPLIKAHRKFSDHDPIGTDFLDLLLWVDKHVGSRLFVEPVTPYLADGVLQERYPMFRFANSFQLSYIGQSNSFQIMFDYIKLIDAQEATP